MSGKGDVVLSWCPCLNPCFNGTYSMSPSDFAHADGVCGLNPCFNGTYSMRILKRNNSP